MTAVKEHAAFRFFKEATISLEEDSYEVRLDGQPVHTPIGNRLRLPSLKMAKSIASEWQDQKSTIDPSTMPSMQLACTVIDRLIPERETIIKEIIGYGASDLLCYRAERPPELVEAQAEAWQPILDWMAQDIGAVLKVTSGVVHLQQDKDSMHVLYQSVSGFDDFSLVAVMRFAQAFTSLSLALAVANGRLDWREGTELAFIDETFQSKRWGEDNEAIMRLNAIRTEVRQAACFLALCQDC